MAQAAKAHSVIPIERIASSIYIIRGEKVMLDSDLAELYGVETKRLNEQVKRNIERFPEHFMFQLSKEELENWRSHFATSNSNMKMGLRRQPYAFTEHGALMLSSVLKSDQAVKVSIAIVDAFVQMRQILATRDDVIQKLNEHDKQIASLYEHVERLLKLPEPTTRKIGYLKDTQEDAKKN